MPAPRTITLHMLGMIAGLLLGVSVAACTLGGLHDATIKAPEYAGATSAANPILAAVVQDGLHLALSPLEQKLDALEKAGIPRDTPFSAAQIFTLLFGGTAGLASVVAALKSNAAHQTGKENRDSLATISELVLPPKS